MRVSEWARQFRRATLLAGLLLAPFVARGDLITQTSPAANQYNYTATSSSQFHGILSNTLAVPTISSVVNGGASGSTNWCYRVVAVNKVGAGAPSVAVCNASGPATLTSSNSEVITWTAVPGATSYQVWRTTAAGTPNTTGSIASSVTASTFTDTGLAASSSLNVGDITGNIVVNQGAANGAMIGGSDDSLAINGVWLGTATSTPNSGNFVLGVTGSTNSIITAPCQVGSFGAGNCIISFEPNGVNAVIVSAQNSSPQVNYIQMESSNTGVDPAIVINGPGGAGGDTNSGLNILPSGAGTLKINSWPVPVLTYSSGVAQTVRWGREVGTCTLGTNCAVTLHFTGGTPVCVCSDTTAANACRANVTSNTAVTFTGTGTDVLAYHCDGLE